MWDDEQPLENPLEDGHGYPSRPGKRTAISILRSRRLPGSDNDRRAAVRAHRPAGRLDLQGLDHEPEGSTCGRGGPRRTITRSRRQTPADGRWRQEVREPHDGDKNIMAGIMILVHPHRPFAHATIAVAAPLRSRWRLLPMRRPGFGRPLGWGVAMARAARIGPWLLRRGALQPFPAQTLERAGHKAGNQEQY